MTHERDIEDLATVLIGSREKAQGWMRAPNRYLGGKAPRDVIDTEEGRDRVKQSLGAIAYGGVG